jgi:hypothetical protein
MKYSYLFLWYPLFQAQWDINIQEVPLLRIKITGQGDEEHIKYQFE